MLSKERIAEIKRIWSHMIVVEELLSHIRAQDELLAAAEKALEAAESFIVNGTALGFIQMPAFVADPAHDTLPMIRTTLSRIREARS